MKFEFAGGFSIVVAARC